MLGLGPALKSAYGRLAPDSRPGARRRLPAWGDGLADQSLTSLWYRCDWESVCDDELAVLIPSLLPRAANEADRGRKRRVALLRRALAARIHWAGLMLDPSTGEDGAGRSTYVTDAIMRTGAVTMLTPNETLEEGQRDFPTLYGREPQGRSAPAHGFSGSDGSAMPARDLLVFELAVLASLDGVLRDARNSPGDDPLGLPALPDVLVATIYSSLNAAYVYPALTCSHELFGLGAWLGYLVRGRAAMMPVFIAEQLADCLAREPGDDRSETGVCERLVRFHADAAVGSRHLLGTARRVDATGRPTLVIPSRAAPSGPARAVTRAWGLFERLVERSGPITQLSGLPSC